MKEKGDGKNIGERTRRESKIKEKTDGRMLVR